MATPTFTKTFTPTPEIKKGTDIQADIQFVKAELCPECGANRTLLKEMMAETATGLETENRTMAKHIISGCQSCRGWWENARSA